MHESRDLCENSQSVISSNHAFYLLETINVWLYSYFMRIENRHLYFGEAQVWHADWKRKMECVR